MISTQEYDLTRPLQSALRAKAPFVGVPMPGQAPLIFKRDLLANALRGVTPIYVDVDGNRNLIVEGTAGDGRVRTRARFTSINIHALRSATFAPGEVQQTWIESQRTKPAKREHNPLARYEKHLHKLQRELDKLGSEPSIGDPLQLLRHDEKNGERRWWAGGYRREYPQEQREAWLRWRALKRQRTVVGAIAHAYRTQGIKTAEKRTGPYWRRGSVVTNTRELYLKLESLGLSVRKFSKLRTHDREAWASNFHEYLDNLWRACGLGHSWYSVRPSLFGYGYSRRNTTREERKEERERERWDNPQHWGAQRYQNRLAWRREKRALEEQIEQVNLLAAEAALKFAHLTTCLQEKP